MLTITFGRLESFGEDAARRLIKSDPREAMNDGIVPPHDAKTRHGQLSPAG